MKIASAARVLNDMKKFKVLVRGEHFLMNVDGVEKKRGFYTTRFVEAQNEEAAESAVMEMLRDDLAESVHNDKSDTPMMYAEEVEEIDSFAGFPVPGGGFTFYPEKKEA
jgi:hypothetical protein